VKDCEEELRWYEKRWEEDVGRLRKEMEELKRLLEEQTEEVLALKRERSRWQERETELSSQIETLSRALRRAQNRSPLGEGFFRYLSKELALWDQALLQEAQKLTGERLLEWMGERWRERKEALNLLLVGEEPDWKRLRTGLLLEWALLGWLEGLEDG
jgi:septal ring factor EnvC (AmiA/AmiB activator)